MEKKQTKMMGSYGRLSRHSPSRRRSRSRSRSRSRDKRRRTRSRSPAARDSPERAFSSRDGLAAVDRFARTMAALMQPPHLQATGNNEYSAFSQHQRNSIFQNTLPGDCFGESHRKEQSAEPDDREAHETLTQAPEHTIADFLASLRLSSPARRERGG